VFIKLGPKHASKDEIERAIFEVLGEFARVLGPQAPAHSTRLQALPGVLLRSLRRLRHTQASTQSTNKNTFYWLSSRRE
jgi:hypothetical protein